MGTIMQKANKIKQTKEEIRDVLLDKGVNLDDTTPFDEYPGKIKDLGGGFTAVQSIPQGDLVEKLLTTATITNN